MLGLVQWGLLATFWVPLVGFGLYGLGIAIYRLFLSPLAKFPGPKLAALTRKYESYYEAYQNYEYLWKIKKLHQKYGPIIRINPHEIHIDDPDFFDKLNSFQGTWDKDPFTSHQFANPGALIGTLDHYVHRKRRAAVLPFFSKQKIYALEPIIQSMVDKLYERMEPYVKSGQPINLRNAFKCFAADTVAEYSFAENGHLLDKPEFAIVNWQEHQQGLRSGLRARYLPTWYMPVVRGAPSWIRDSIDPAAKHFEVWHKDVSGPVNRMEEKKNEDLGIGHRTIFHELLNSPHLPPEEKGSMRLIQEAGALVGAGGESTSQVLTAIAYSLVASPEMLRKLRDDLHHLMPSANAPMPSLKQLEQLPYLTGCVKEGLRLRTGKIARHQRLPRDKPLYYGEYEIPAGTIVAMTPIFQQVDPSIYPDPHSFKPERWLNLQEHELKRMDHYLVPYSKGLRQCAGLTLANAELYMAIAAFAVRFDFELFQSDAWDTEMAVDADHHSPKFGSKGVQAFAHVSTF